MGTKFTLLQLQQLAEEYDVDVKKPGINNPVRKTKSELVEDLLIEMLGDKYSAPHPSSSKKKKRGGKKVSEKKKETPEKVVSSRKISKEEEPPKKKEKPLKKETPEKVDTSSKKIVSKKKGKSSDTEERVLPKEDKEDKEDKDEAPPKKAPPKKDEAPPKKNPPKKDEDEAPPKKAPPKKGGKKVTTPKKSSKKEVTPLDEDDIFPTTLPPSFDLEEDDITIDYKNDAARSPVVPPSNSTLDAIIERLQNDEELPLVISRKDGNKIREFFKKRAELLSTFEACMISENDKIRINCIIETAIKFNLLPREDARVMRKSVYEAIQDE